MDFLRQSNSPRLPGLALLLLTAIYLLSGVVGHDPWKTEDAIHLGIAYGFATQGHWLFPHIAGEAWPHTAPLYHWVATLLGKLFGGFLPFHDAARLATPFFGAIFLYALSRAARVLHGETAALLAPLLAIGTLGLLLPFHEAQPAVAGLACAAIAYWGGGLAQQGRIAGALLIGLGLGLSFPAHGLVGVVMACAPLATLLARRNWRHLLTALCLALPLLAAWPLALKYRAPHLWAAWWRNEWAEATIARALPEMRHLEQISWALWPILPLALWGTWINRRQIDTLALGILGVVLGALWYLSGSSRLLGLMPLIVPLALLAAAGTDKLRRGAANAFDWFGVMTFSMFAGLIWLGASAQGLDWPPKVARNFDKLAPGHEVSYSIAALLFAAAITLAWLATWRLPRAAWRASLHWACGTTLLWALTATLWFSWIDHAKSYRAVAMELKQSLPDDVDCIERDGIGAAQRASLEYFTALRTVPPTQKKHCAWRLTLDERDHVTPSGWTLVWQGGRPSDRKEKWFLERRND